ncbi:MAG TPA: hypothetical protein VF482_18610, partial [Trebonia sp.]
MRGVSSGGAIPPSSPLLTGEPPAPPSPPGSPQKGDRPASSGGVSWPRWAWRQLTTMRTALVLLFL